MYNTGKYVGYTPKRNSGDYSIVHVQSVDASNIRRSDVERRRKEKLASEAVFQSGLFGQDEHGSDIPPPNEGQPTDIDLSDGESMLVGEDARESGGEYFRLLGKSYATDTSSVSEMISRN